ncbi:hypothetical protein PRK78_006802 [Emydomyces testavorans]|uniref:Uncharacterized protein n=1 Tax=Emydomyces testavorans TaxID=2070801 RepID=A0AAF0DP41_9EURO|nr:hypothetical protein PRK78_006802 [Emydomyces testavorans]
MAERPGDRPERPPVWVRGGPPTYYHPSRPQGVHTLEQMRRTSTGTTDSTRSEPSSLPASPVLATISTLEHPQAETRTTTTHTRGGTSEDAQPVSLRPSMPKRRSSSPSTSTAAGQKKYAGLTYQKRTSLDEETKRRVASWREQPVGSNPPSWQWASRWWDS